MTNIANQYRIIADGAGWRRPIERGLLRFDGADRLSFLQALVTNDVGSLAPGQGAYAAYLTPQGRMIADLHVFARTDHLVAGVPGARAAHLAELFDRLIFSEDVQVRDISASMIQIQVIGGGAARIVAQALGMSGDRLRTLATWAHLDAGSGLVARTDDANLDSYVIFAPAADESGLVRSLGQAGATPLSAELAEALRIECGRPAFGIDMNEETIPLEAGLLDRAISTTKGCYVGQEIIIRVLHRGGGRVAKRLVKLVSGLDPAVAPPVGTPVLLGEQEVGRVTSAAASPRDSRFIALAYVQRDVAEVGRVVTLGAPSGSTVEIAALAG